MRGERNFEPKLQVALDLPDLDEALRIAEDAYKGGADFIEAGTPLIKSVGMEAIRRLKKRFPQATIIADMKTLDVGWLETEIAAQAGADIVSLSGLAHNNTIKDAISCARKHGIKIMVDLLQVKNPLKRAKEIQKLGADYVCLHTGIDAQRDREEEVDKKVAMIRKTIETVEIPVAVAGGIKTETAAKVVNAGAKVVVIGREITRAASPEAATMTIKKAMRKSVK